MRLKLLFILIIFCINYSLANTEIKLLKIYDGDTIKAKINKEEFSIRLIGIDCWETSIINRTYKQAYENNINVEEVIKQGKIAKKYLENLYKKSSKNVSFDFYGIDKYSRVLGILYFDKININQKLLENGICKEFIY